MRANQATAEIRLGLKANWPQFSLLLLVNAFVGEFQLAAKAAILSFIVVFGISKALTNYLAGRLSDRYGRKTILVAGWLVAVPVPFLLIWAPSWSWVLAANLLLGVSQGSPGRRR
jgi:MFS family permease